MDSHGFTPDYSTGNQNQQQTETGDGGKSEELIAAEAELEEYMARRSVDMDVLQELWENYKAALSST